MTAGSPGENEDIFEAAMAGGTNTREVRAWNEHWQRPCPRRDYIQEHPQTDLSVLPMATGSPGENEDIFEAAMAEVTNTREVRAWNEH
jgi:hypothetical protein